MSTIEDWLEEKEIEYQKCVRSRGDVQAFCNEIIVDCYKKLFNDEPKDFVRIRQQLEYAMFHKVVLSYS